MTMQNSKGSLSNLTLEDTTIRPNGILSGRTDQVVSGRTDEVEEGD